MIDKSPYTPGPQYPFRSNSILISDSPRTPFTPVEDFSIVVHLHAYQPSEPQIITLTPTAVLIRPYISEPLTISSPSNQSSPNNFHQPVDSSPESQECTFSFPLSELISMDTQTYTASSFPYRIVLHVHSNQTLRSLPFYTNSSDKIQELRSALGLENRGKWLVLLNPKGGNGSAKEVFEKSKDIIMGAGYDLCWMETRWEHDAFSIIRNMDKQAFQGYDRIVCCSGDGIIHEVINGFYARQDREDLVLRIGALPAGSACSLVYYGLKKRGMEMSFENALFMLLRGKIVQMELMKFVIQPHDRVGIRNLISLQLSSPAHWVLSRR